MATSTAQTVPLVELYDYYLAPGDPVTATTSKGKSGRTVKVTLNYDKGVTLSPDPIVWVAQETTYTALTDLNGFWHVYLVPNNKISPANTYYTVEIEGGPSYQVQLTDVGVPAVGWQSSAANILLNVPANLAPTTSTVGAITATGLITAQAGINVTAGGATIAGGLTVSGGETDTGGLTVDTITYSSAASRLIPGATSFSIRNNANNADNLIITNAGNATLAGSLTVSAGGAAITGNSTVTGTLTVTQALTVNAGGATVTGNSTITGTLTVTALVTVQAGLTVSAGNLTITAGNLTMGAAASQIVPGATSLGLQNHANSASNLLLTDAGLATFRNAVTIPPAAGATAPTTNYGTVVNVIDYQTPAAVATITIPASGSLATGYRHLKVEWKLKSSSAVAAENIKLQFNGSSAANYYNEYLDIFNGAVTGTEVNSALGTSIVLGNVPGTSAPANTFASGEITIFDYNSGTDHKTCIYSTICRRGTSTSGVDCQMGGAGWVIAPTAITTLTITATGNLTGFVTTKGIP
jgi:hypothetical protein